MKRYFYFLIVALTMAVCFSQCKKDRNKYQSRGLITGADYRMCACCGGYFIKIDTAQYRFSELPANSGIDLEKDTFPIRVELDWAKRPQACMGDEIIVLRIHELK